MTDEQREQAAEYVLGTLAAEERTAFEQALRNDRELQRLVWQWERQLQPLADLSAPVAPPDHVWSALEQRIAGLTAGAAEIVPSAELEPLRRSRGRWRLAALTSAAIAAGLVLFIAVAGLLAPAGEEYLAVVNRGGELPALIVRVDTREGVVRVRSLAAEAPPDRSLELWYIGGGQEPRSLGLIDRPDQALQAPGVVQRAALEGATLAVSLEPKGGSPTGSPTGPVVYSGQLIRE